MSAAIQRVVILAGRVLSSGRFNTAPERQKVRKAIQNALQVLTSAPEPVIKLHDVLVMSEFPGNQRAEIRFTDLTADNDDANQVVQLP